MTGAPGRGTGAGACPRGHCRLAACPGGRFGACSASHPSITSSIYSCTARHAQLRDLGLRLEIKSRSGQIMCPVRFLYAPRLRLSDLFAIHDLSDFYPITGRRPMQNFRVSPLPPPRSPRSPIHVVIPPSTTIPLLRSLDVLSARGERAHPRVLRSPTGFRSFYPRHRLSSAGVSPPTSHHQHRAHRFAWWSPLLVPCSGFNELQRPQLALGVLSL